MSIASTANVVVSASGSHLAQTTGADIERIQRDAANQQRQIDFDHQADNAAGIGETEPDQEAGQRDADGRRPWEIGSQKQASDRRESSPSASIPPHDGPQQCGQSVDLTA